MCTLTLKMLCLSPLECVSTSAVLKEFFLLYCAVRLALELSECIGWCPCSYSTAIQEYWCSYERTACLSHFTDSVFCEETRNSSGCLVEIWTATLRINHLFVVLLVLLYSFFEPMHCIYSPWQITMSTVHTLHKKHNTQKTHSVTRTLFVCVTPSNFFKYFIYTLYGRVMLFDVHSQIKIFI